ncbi:MAG: FAD-binding oxidoreductase [Deltaproteobacteria bacterium]|nr:FAD-binding oxidoreductase [Deltaproteobacteria bacterium]
MTPEFVRIASVIEPSESQRALASDLARLCDGRASAGSQDRIAYARDLWPKATYWAGLGKVPRPPDAICWPRDEKQLANVVAFARARKIPLIPFGAGSGVCGGAIALTGGITVDLKRMDRLRSVDHASRLFTAQGGIIGENLERELAAHGLSLGHFPSSIYCSTLGGWLAARSAGQLSTKYGKIEDMCQSLTAVLGTGELVKVRARPSNGPDFTQLLIGSEGTLGFITEATMFAVPQPATRAYRAVRFRTLEAGAEAIRRILRDGLRPAVVRLYDPFDTVIAGKGKTKFAATDEHHRDGIQVIQERAPLAAKLAVRAALGKPAALNRLADLLRECLLILVFEGDADLCSAEDEQALILCRELGGVDLGAAPARHWMEQRYAVSYKQSKMFAAGAFADTMEVCATWDKVLPVYRAVRQAVSPLGFIMAHLSHAYVEGCSLYFTFSATAPSPEEVVERYDAVWREALGAAMAAGATVSHHHGVGFSKAGRLHEELGSPGVNLLRALKRTCDPDGILNPGKLGLGGEA